LVAFSGGVDSTLLLKLAQDAIGNKLLAVTAKSLIHRQRDIQRASDFCKDLGIRHLIVESREMKINEFLRNKKDRCFHCKKDLFRILAQIADENNINSIAHGANYDDLRDYRPGLQAAEEAGVIAPLVDAGLTKKEIRQISKEMNLPTHELPATTCLATRIPYGSPITEEKIIMVYKAEKILENEGLKVIRVRHHGTVARIEVMKNQIGYLLDLNIEENISEKFKQIGFDHIAVDLEGYIPGKMNRSVVPKI
jgi:uncharacterized protein